MQFNNVRSIILDSKQCRFGLGVREGFVGATYTRCHSSAEQHRVDENHQQQRCVGCDVMGDGVEQAILTTAVRGNKAVQSSSTSMWGWVCIGILPGNRWVVQHGNSFDAQHYRQAPGDHVIQHDGAAAESRGQQASGRVHCLQSSTGENYCSRYA